ncbi:unnamed protein product [Rotaria sp. Silwood2]|nr:unnamed protein product [Rotaria sp. Silwood2]CAF3170995.1 unnamed protein product [Rotaria sp. Silwood2]CAF3434672.1 unnamed protein product [Rotaria sp. Silwood2]CAF4521677.1 unnamed protein product [Rotaria sp. Silwood2]CAF4541287.1 unnamed protein product [Rotaria sp. Silwood2]
MKRGSYSKEDLIKAVNDYKNGFTSSAVAEKYSIPRSTIRKHSYNPELKIGGGHPMLLLNEQEQYLVQLFKNLEQIGVRLTKKVALDLSSDYVRLVTGSMSNSCYEKLEEILQKHNLITRPHAIFNCDENGFGDETVCELIIVSHKTKHVYEQSGDSGKSFTTGLICGNAAGKILPPFIIYAAKNLNYQWTLDGPKNSQYAVSDSGWITKSLFCEWFKCVAKQCWKKIVSRYFYRSGRKTIRKQDLPSLFNKLYASAFSPKQVLAGFTRFGVWPFNSPAVKEKVVKQPLGTKQINHPTSTSNSESFPTSSTLPASAAHNMISDSTSSYVNDQHTQVMTLNISNNNENLNYLSNPNSSFDTIPTASQNNMSFSKNFSSSSLSNQITNIPPLPSTNQSFNISYTSSLNAYDLLQFPSFIPDIYLNTNSSSHSNLSFNKSNSTTSLPHLNIGYEPRGFSAIANRNYHHPNKRPYMSMIDFEEDGNKMSLITPIPFSSLDNETTRTYTELTTVNKTNYPQLPNFIQTDQLNNNKENNDSTSSNRLSPSIAVRATVTNLFQQTVLTSLSSAKPNKRIRTEGKYGEEITSSNKLNELKEKASKSNAKKRTTASTARTSTTFTSSNDTDSVATKKVHRSTKRSSESTIASQGTHSNFSLEA